MNIKIHHSNGFHYVEEGEGPILLLLHGLFGALSNWADVLRAFSPSYKVIIPLMPIYEKTKVGTSIEGLTQFVESFVAYKQLQHFSLIGNSLGGHIALTYTLRNQSKVDSLVLTGSSGLFESGMGTGFPRRSSYSYIKERVEYTFYAPEVATPDLIEEVFDIVNDNFKALRILRIARSAQRHNLRNDLHEIHVPTLLIWGLNDNITPSFVGHAFESLIPNAELHFIDKCGHAPMMEQAEQFNKILHSFLLKHIYVLNT